MGWGALIARLDFKVYNMLKIRGPSRLEGKIILSGAKNAALPMVCACLLTDEPVTLTNCPVQLNDVRRMLDCMRQVGVSVEVDKSAGAVKLTSPEKLTEISMDAECGSVRTTLLFLGAMLERYGEIEVPLPGGCQIGERKYDLHLMGLRSMGAQIEERSRGLLGKAQGLKGGEIDFYLPSTTGTENIMLAAALARGKTILRNANTRPEVKNLAGLLSAMGAKIKLSPRVVEIEGVEKLHGCEYKVMPGADEAVSYLIAGAMTGGEIMIEDVRQDDVHWDVKILKEAGCEVFFWGGNVYLSRRGPLRPIDLFTGPFPAINSDMQPLFAVMAGCAGGRSTITDMRFTDRFQYAEQVRKLGMNIQILGNTAIVDGPTKWRGARVRASDLRCGAALVLAGLVSEGVTEIENVYQIQRGYEDLASKLNGLGAAVERVDES